jgi:hypothetical protein
MTAAPFNPASFRRDIAPATSASINEGAVMFRPDRIQSASHASLAA